MGNRGDLTNEQWERIKLLLPKEKTKRGRPSQDHRTVLNGISWVLRTGAPWRDTPERYGKWTTIYSRFQRWRKAGVWDRMFAELQTTLEREGHVDWEIHFIDSTTVRAHQHAAGAKKVVPRRRR
jgi:transposase